MLSMCGYIVEISGKYIGVNSINVSTVLLGFNNIHTLPSEKFGFIHTTIHNISSWFSIVISSKLPLFIFDLFTVSTAPIIRTKS